MCDGGDPGGDPGAPGSIGSMGDSPGDPGQGDTGDSDGGAFGGVGGEFGSLGFDAGVGTSTGGAIGGGGSGQGDDTGIGPDTGPSVGTSDEGGSLAESEEEAAATAATTSGTISGSEGDSPIGTQGDDTFSDDTSTTPSHSVGQGGTVGDDTGHGGAMTADVDPETGQLTGTTSYSAHSSVTAAAVAAAQAALAEEDDTMMAAYSEGLIDVTPENVDIAGQMTAQGLANMQAPIGTNTIATGRHSIASAWGARSQAVQEGKSVSAQDMVSLQNQAIDPSTGQMTNVLNIAAPAMNTPAFEQASRTSFVAGALNPDVAAAIGFVSQAVMPGFMGALAGALQAAQAEEMGLPAPGLLGSLGTTGVAAIDDTMDTISSTLSSAEVAVGQGIFGAVEGVLGFASDALDDTLGQALSAVESGITDFGVSIGAFDAVDPADAAETAAATASFDDAGGSIGQAGGDPPALPPPAPTVTPTPEPRSTAPAVGAVDTFLDTSATTPLVSIPDIATPTLGVDEDLGVTPMMTTLPRRSSFRRSRVTSARDRAFGAANLFRPTLSAGISL
jgi:hypothetical protein